MDLLAFVVGTRPEIIKIAPLIHECKKQKLNFVLISTGQHYDKELSVNIFCSLDLPQPDYNLKVKENFPTKKLSEMLLKLGELFHKISPNVVLAVGDTISVLAACLTSIQNKIPFAHIEAGIRSFDYTMPEELNRRLVDSVSSILFAPTEKAVLNLYYEGIEAERVFLTGNPIVDVVKKSRKKIENYTNPALQEVLTKINSDFIVCTLHRESNVDNKEKLAEIISALRNIDYKIVFLLHPRTKKRLVEFKLKDLLQDSKNILISPPLDYLSMLKLIMQENCKLIITDSGGLQEESALIKKPCLTLRTNTERPETIEFKINFLVEIKAEKIVKMVEKILNDKEIKERLESFPNIFGDGNAGRKIIQILKENYDIVTFKPPITLKSGCKNYGFKKIEQDISQTAFEEKFSCKVSAVIDEKGKTALKSKILKKDYIVKCEFYD
ncbi:MAG: non-hydrolyzing UDP-N-acetylglucosamine 2-epimerase [Candidatus Heimdallarchaeaceae archaeon]